MSDFPAIPPAQINSAVSVFPARYADPMRQNDKLQQALNRARTSLSAAQIAEMSQIPLKIVHLDADVRRQRQAGGAAAYPAAGFLDRQVHFSGSLVKVAAMYAAFELGVAAKKFAADLRPAAADGPALFAALRDNFKSRIKSAVPEIVKTAKITDEHTLPHYEKLFDASRAPGGGFTVDLKQSIKDDFDAMVSLRARGGPDAGGIPASNEAARNIIHAVGYGYINGALAAGGFYEPPGVWLAGDYMSEWPPVEVWSENDGNVRTATTVHHMAKLYVLAHDRTLVGPKSSASMLAILETGGSWFTTTSPKLSTDETPFKITHAKVGLGGLKSKQTVMSEGSILREKAHGADFVVVWQNLNGDQKLNTLGKLIKDTLQNFFAP